MSSSPSSVPDLLRIAGAGWCLVTIVNRGTLVQTAEPTPFSMLDQLVRYRVTHTAMVPAVIQDYLAATEKTFKEGGDVIDVSGG